MKSFCLRFPDGKPKAMTFSYDDGVKSDEKLVGLMRKYGIRGTFNINTLYFEDEENPNRLSKDYIKSLANDPNFEIACHGHTHPYYNYLPQTAAFSDIFTNRTLLEKMTDKIIRGFAYPFGGYNTLSQEVLKNCGIVYARTTKATKEFELPENWLEWHPTCHHRDSLECYERFAKISKSAGKPCIMCVWGHSFEFATSDYGWELIETLFERCHKNKDIWFATNMQIYNYVNAFNSLVFSADGSKVYNPGALDLWALVDGNWKPDSGQLIKIPAGQTVDL